MKLHRPLLVAVLPLLALSACASLDDAGSPAAADGKLSVVASFYPLQFATQRVAGDLAEVTNLTKPGSEPHDLELTARAVASLTDADLVVYLAGFQPAVDDAVSAQAAAAGFDVGKPARLDLSVAAGPGEESPAGGTDPHFWLDPTRLADVADAIAERLSTLDPANSAAYAANATALRDELSTLDAQFTEGLANCRTRDLVTSHAAFGYLAQRYDLSQRGIVGLSPEADPDAATLAAVADFVREYSIDTIYYETLISPAIARTVALETGAGTAVLDPIEGLTDAQAGDYLSVMRANLTTLRTGQACQ